MEFIDLCRCNTYNNDGIKNREVNGTIWLQDFCILYEVKII